MIDWKKLRENPLALVDVIAKSESALFDLELLKRKLYQEIKEERTIKRERGYLFEGPRKEKLISDVAAIDPQLSGIIKKLENKDQVIAAFEERINMLKEVIKEYEVQLKELVKKEQETTFEGNEIVMKFLHILEELRKEHTMQLENIEANELYERRLLAATQSGGLDSPALLDQLIKEAEQHARRNQANKLSAERTQLLLQEAAQLRQNAANVELRFEKEIEDISTIREKIVNLLSSFKRAIGLGKKREKEFERKVV